MNDSKIKDVLLTQNVHFEVSDPDHLSVRYRVEDQDDMVSITATSTHLHHLNETPLVHLALAHPVVVYTPINLHAEVTAARGNPAHELHPQTDLDHIHRIITIFLD